jgi:hypothetical protein
MRRQLRRLATTAVLALLAVPSARTAVVELDRDVIEKAIASGRVERPKPYSFPNPLFTIAVVTPYLRVALAAAGSARADLDPDRLPADLTRSEFDVEVRPIPIRPTRVKRISVLQDAMSVAPISQRELIDKMQTSREKHIVLKGVAARFPISALKPGLRFRLEMEDGREEILTPPAGWVSQID